MLRFFYVEKFGEICENFLVTWYKILKNKKKLVKNAESSLKSVKIVKKCN